MYGYNQYEYKIKWMFVLHWWVRGHGMNMNAIWYECWFKIDGFGNMEGIWRQYEINVNFTIDFGWLVVSLGIIDLTLIHTLIEVTKKLFFIFLIVESK